jgi:hypothetical protein
MAMYRAKTAKSIIEGTGYLVHVRGKSVDGDTTTTFQVTALQLGGSYLMRVVDRLFLGPGASVTVSVQGKGKVEAPSGSADGDYKISQLAIAPLMIKLEI